MALLPPFVAALGLALVHLLADRIHSRGREMRRRWLSFAGGTSVAFVLMHLMPELAAGQRVMEDRGVLPELVNDHVYLLALVGVVTYYGAEHMALQRTGRRGPKETSDRGGTEGFWWIHTALFVVFNLLMGFLLVREHERLEWPAFAVLWIALALHLFTNDFALRAHHRDDYHRAGRWMLAGAVVAGWLAGTVLEPGDAAFMLPLAFAAGGIMLNTLKEELPAERESHFVAFAAGAVVYAGIMLVV